MRRLLLSISLLLAHSTLAATYYADNGATGCGASSSTYDPATRACGSGSATMRSTVQAAYNLATLPGDIVYVRTGDYAEIITTAAGGAAGSFIKLLVYPSDVSSTNQWDAGHWPVTISRWDQSSGAATNHIYQWVEGFRIDGPYGTTTDSGLTIRSPLNVFTNCWLTLGAMAQTYANIIAEANSNLFTHCLFYPGTNYVGGHTGTNSTTGFVVDTNLSMIVDSLVGFVIHNWDDSDSSATILSNTVDTIYHGALTGGFSNSWSTGQRFVAGPSPEIAVSIAAETTTIRSCIFTNFADTERIFNAAHSPNTTIEHCLITGTKASFAVNGNHVDIFQILDEGASTITFATNWVIQFNRFFNNDCQGSNLEMDPPYMQNWIVRGNIWARLNSQWGPKVKGSQYYNNTLINVGDTYPFGFWTDDNTRVYNNVIIGDNANATNLCRFIGSLLTCNATAAAEGTLWDVNNNYYASWTNGFPALNMSYLTNCAVSTSLCDSAPVTGVDPLFTDIVGYNFLPAASSPLINAGKDLADVWPTALDMNGVAFATAGGWPIGAISASSASIPDITGHVRLRKSPISTARRR